MLKALLFDCDGVLVDTERDGHRVAFNRAFAQKDLDAEWSVEEYGELLKVAGGKERMRHYFDANGWLDDASDRDEYIKELHRLKTDIYMEIVEAGELPLRPGVARLIDEAIQGGLMLAVCSTSNERAVNAIVENMLGMARKNCFSGIFAGDIVSKKKPDPEIYTLALQKLGIEESEGLVVEDSLNGLRAAKAAGFHCLVTTNAYTEHEDFRDADLTVPELGDEPNVNVTLKELQEIAADW